VRQTDRCGHPDCPAGEWPAFRHGSLHLLGHRRGSGRNCPRPGAAPFIRRPCPLTTPRTWKDRRHNPRVLTTSAMTTFPTLARGKSAARSAGATQSAAESLLADRLSDAPHVLVGVGDEGARHELLHRERRRVVEDHATLDELLVAQPAQHGGGL